MGNRKSIEILISQSNTSQRKFFKKDSERNHVIERQIFTRRNFSFCLFSSFELYIWGRYEEDSIKFNLSPTLLTLPKKKKFSFITCGYGHTICLTENNLCYVWGSNSYGQLGLGHTNNRSNPTLFSLPNNERISFITCGAVHTICLTENNLCYVWGCNNFGELGLGDMVEFFCSTPTLLTLPNNERISFITCGANHTICLTENNSCYVWGRNEYGQLGLDDRINRSDPTLLTLPNNERISFITCGAVHTICLTENNLCYVWGRNKFGQLGLDDINNRCIPTLFSLPNNERISFIACGDSHTICLTENNLCYVWGWNQFYQLGLGDRTNRYIPTSLNLPNNERISFIACGDSHTICLTENNLCYVWGWNGFGQLGLGDTSARSSPTLLKLP